MGKYTVNTIAKKMEAGEGAQNQNKKTKDL